MSLIDSMPHLCTIRVFKPEKDALGGRTLGVTDVSTGNQCWEQPASDAEVTEFAKRGIEVRRKVYFPSEPVVEENHEILITSRDGGVTTIADPLVLKVQSESIPDATAGLGWAYKVMCLDQTGGNQ